MLLIVKISLLCLLAYLTLEPTAAQSASGMQVSDDQIDMALNDKRYLMRQLKCALGEAPCDPIGRRLRHLAPLILKNACSQCTQQDKTQVTKVLTHIQRNYPKEWAKLIRQYSGFQGKS